MNDLEYMKLAVTLARRGSGRVNPNPMVGAVIVKDDKIIGQGYHEKFGTAHAEINALASCTTSPKGATIYVTLEPCCHYGKTPPCTEAIIRSGISRVVIGTPDVNPLVSGKGASLLQQHGIQVDIGILKHECDQLIKVFKKFIIDKRPFVLMKYAMTVDGKIATYTGASKWISCEESRLKVHELRNEFSAIMVGIGTVMKDDPMLNCRMENGKNPIRIICDTHLKLPLTSNIAKTARSIETFIATCQTDDAKMLPYKNLGCKFITVDKKDELIDLNQLMLKLGEMDIDSVLLEGGGRLNWSALNQRIVQETAVFIAPKIFGGKALTPISGVGVSKPGDAVKLNPYSFSKVGSDFLIESEVIYSCSRES